MNIYAAGSILLLSKIPACSRSRTPTSTHFLPFKHDERRPNLQNDFTRYYRPLQYRVFYLPISTALLPLPVDYRSQVRC